LPPEPSAAPEPAAPEPARTPRPDGTLELADRDKDTVGDLEDRCPLLPGSLADAGCPQLIRFDENSGAITLLQPIRFQGDAAELHARSAALLDEVAAALSARPEARLRIEGHAIRRGRKDDPDSRSAQRAVAVASALIARGVDASRLEAMGCGENRPRVSSRGAQKQKNERIELYVFDPLPPAGMPSTLGCTLEPLPGQPAKTVAPLPQPKPVVQAPPPPRPIVQAPPPVAAPAPAPPPATKPAPSKAALPAVAGAAGAAQVLAALANDPGGDRDRDGARNDKDECPLAPGSAGAACPEGHRVDLAAGRIELLKPIRFDEGTARLDARGKKHLDEIAATLRANPEMKVALTADVAADAGSEPSLALTRERASAVRRELTGRGVAPSRIQAYGCGENRPVAPNNVPWGRKKNERVELLLLDPAPTTGVHSLTGCSAAE
jgi:outer membrane protein OmpA-like peptidoglycan-associated protein